MRCLRSLLLFLLSENESSEKDKDMEENAAIKIQAAFRGHLAREKVKKMKSSDLQGKTEENEWGGWLYTPENTKKSKSINLVVTVLFFLISEIWGSEITFVAVVKICREHVFNKHAIEPMPLEDFSEIMSLIYTSPRSMSRDPWI